MAETKDNNNDHVDSSITEAWATPSSKRMKVSNVVQVEVEMQVMGKVDEVELQAEVQVEKLVLEAKVGSKTFYNLLIN